jgi:hypothetical protein
MNNILRHAASGTALLCLGGLAPAAQAAEGEGWDWVVAPYGWAADISTDLQLRNPPPPTSGAISTDTRFTDIVDKIDGAFQIHIEGQGDHWGMFTDFTFLGLADEHDRPRFHTESDLDTRLFELAAVWSPDEHRYHGLDLFAGLRYIDVDLTAQLEPVNPLFATHRIDTGETYNDFMLGARYTWALSDRWGLTLRGDGSFGDTDGTWNASAVANYKMKRGAWYFGYRYLSVEVENDTGHQIDITLNGPMIGYGFAF